MDHSRPHQAHAAQCRHAAAHRGKALYCAELNTRFLSFQERFPNASASESLRRFCAIERRFVVARGRTGQSSPFRPSTYQAWLRAWRRMHEGADEARQADRLDLMPPARFANVGPQEFLRDDATAHQRIDASILPSIAANPEISQGHQL